MTNTQQPKFTLRQLRVLRDLCVMKRTAKWLGVRSDVLWRLEERGYVTRNSDMEPRWTATAKGREAIDTWDAR